MATHVDWCTSKACRRPYLVEWFSKAFAPEVDPGVIVCPHCGNYIAANNEYVYRTKSLRPDWERWDRDGDEGPADNVKRDVP